MAKGTINIPTNLYLKFQVKTPSGYGETRSQRLNGAKTVFFHPKSPEICVTSERMAEGTTTSPLTYI